MIDIFSITPGDIVEYGPYLSNCDVPNSKGVYQDFKIWSPDERPVEMWLNLIGESDLSKGMKIFIRASQVIAVHRTV